MHVSFYLALFLVLLDRVEMLFRGELKLFAGELGDLSPKRRQNGLVNLRQIFPSQCPLSWCMETEAARQETQKSKASQKSDCMASPTTKHWYSEPQRRAHRTDSIFVEQAGAGMRLSAHLAHKVYEASRLVGTWLHLEERKVVPSARKPPDSQQDCTGFSRNPTISYSDI